MKKSVCPKWVLETVIAMEKNNIDLYDLDDVLSYLVRKNDQNMLKWINSNRSLYNLCVLNSQHKLIDFYYD